LQTLSPGKHNPRLIAIRKAVRAAELTPEGLLPIEGPKLLEEAVRSGIEVTDVFLRRGVGTIGIPETAAVFELDAVTFKSLQNTETSQGIIALVRPPSFPMDRILSVANPLIVVLGRLQDPGNVGTILRVAESFFATGCLALTGTAGMYNPKTVRASAGSIFRLPHVWNLELAGVTQHLKRAGIDLVGTSPSAELTIGDWDWRRPVAVLIGNEGSGLSGEERDACDAVLRIPQKTTVESLNSAMAAAVILYEASKHERITV
jgi:RNA methyltransferase, TrmH family